MGVIFGAIVVNSMSFTQKEDLFYYLSQFFGEVSNGKVAESNDLFLQSFFHNSKFIGLMWVTWNFDYWVANYLYSFIYKRNGCGFYRGIFSQPNGLEWFYACICIDFAAKFNYYSVFIIMAANCLCHFH